MNSSFVLNRKFRYSFNKCFSASHSKENVLLVNLALLSLKEEKIGIGDQLLQKEGKSSTKKMKVAVLL